VDFLYKKLKEGFVVRKSGICILILVLAVALLVAGCSNEEIADEGAKKAEGLKVNIKLEEILTSDVQIASFEDHLTITQVKVDIYEGNNITGQPLDQKFLEDISGDLEVAFDQVEVGKKYTLDVKLIGKLEGDTENQVLYQGSNTSGKISAETVTTVDVTAKPLPAKSLEVNVESNKQIDQLILMHPGTEEKIKKEGSNQVTFANGDNDVELFPAEWVLEVIVGEDSITKDVLLLPTEAKSIDLKLDYDSETGELTGDIIVPTSPDTPNNLRLNKSNSLTWDTVEGATSYSIYYSANENIDSREYVDTVNSNTYQEVEDGYYWVRAYSNQFSGDISTSYLVELDDNNDDSDDNNDNKLVQEAEAAELTGFNVKEDETASNQQYIVSDHENTGDPSEDHKTVFKFDIEKKGRYKIRARTSSKGATEGSNSFYVKVNEGNSNQFHLERTAEWKDNDYDVSYNLDQGTTEVVIYARESGTCLDKLELVYLGEIEAGEWFKSKSTSEIKQLDNGLLWDPVNKPTTVHRYFEPTQLEVGETVTFSMDWESDGRDGSAKDDWESDPAFLDERLSDQGEGISDPYLRALAGTGDFRVGFFESGEKVGSGTKDGIDGNEKAKKFNDYKGFQFRMHPHLSRGFEEQDARLIEDGSESHININLWTRFKPGKYGLMSDEAQNSEDDHYGGRSFSKGDDWGTQPQQWGPNMPFGEARKLIVKVTMTSETEYEVTVTLNGHTAPLLTGTYDGDFKPEYFDTLAITYTNQSRRYDYVKITDFTVESDTSDNNDGNNDNDDSDDNNDNDSSTSTIYTFDNTNLDTTGNHAAELMGGANYSDIAKVGSHSVNMNGSDDYVELPSHLANATDFTFAAWLKWDIKSEWQRIFSAGKDTNNTMFLTPQASDGKLRFRIDKNNDKQVIRTDYEVEGDTWEHVAVTLAGDTGKIYVNGELIKTKTDITYNPAELNIENFWLGKSQFDDPNLNGRLDDVRIYQRALSGDEIKELLN
jgi:hypothetical protein